VQKSKKLGVEKISKLLFNLSAPATIGMLVIALYNIVDTIFVGRGVGTLAIAGVSVVFPIQMIITTMGQTIGVGSASLISRFLGADDLKSANRVFGNLLTLIFAFSFIIVCFGYIFIKPVLILFGAQGEIYQSAYDYFIVLLPGLFLLNFAMAINNIIRAEGNAKHSMFSLLIAAIANIILDPIFIFVFDLGVKGAAWATNVAQLFTFIYLLYYYKSGKSELKFLFANLKLDKKITEETFAIGAASSVRHGAQGILSALLNNLLVVFGGEIAVAAFGIINRIMRVVFLPLIGIAQGFMPIAGFNYGAGNFKRVKKVFNTASLWSTIFSLTCFFILFFFPTQIMKIFSNDIQLVELGSYALRIIILMLPIIGFQMIGGGYYQAIGKAGQAMFLALLRQTIILIPLILILPNLFGLNGIWYSFPIADLLSAIITVFVLLPEFKQLKKTDADFTKIENINSRNRSKK